jgi:hypothetical protein
MRLTDAYIFKSPIHMDWPAVEKAVRDMILELHPKGSAPSQELWQKCINLELRRSAERIGVGRLYRITREESRQYPIEFYDQTGLVTEKVDKIK